MRLDGVNRWSGVGMCVRAARICREIFDLILLCIYDGFVLDALALTFAGSGHAEKRTGLAVTSIARSDR